MDPIRYGFIQTIVEFVESLPPLLQFLLGVFITIGIIKTLMIVADFFDKKREG
ncbi:MAG: hypothetical protein GWM98_17545 [Nitrospinaceae bacterium]|nr:hypothetical protein [Nitrospinaceae bacterium]NIR55955.1 hypothetical protein [Nitrospinaceae bacterium]NIS86398.1 hypothetical protein [Nitrospinaceae bacterium]NIT83236.1 hypothetical protein [Nitrospinaceae bacterium]NIU45441.1 hypothetical protein [Nitrospinaceae bacterium]